MSEPTTADEILSAMAGAYAQCRSYRDAGTLTQHVFPNERADYTTTKRFSTAFVRPDRFRFEDREFFFRSEIETRRVVWCHGDEIRDWADRGRGEPELNSAESLPDLLTTISGVSRRLSWVVPFLFLPGWGNGSYWHLSRLVRLNDDHIGAVNCYRVQGHFAITPGHDEVCQRAVRENISADMTWNPQVAPTTFWIEKERLLLRRFEDSGRVANFRFEVSADYEPEIDVPITDAELAMPQG